MEQDFQSSASVKDYVLQDEKLLWTGKPVKPIKLLPGEKFPLACGACQTGDGDLGADVCGQRRYSAGAAAAADHGTVFVLFLSDFL